MNVSPRGTDDVYPGPWLHDGVCRKPQLCSDRKSPWLPRAGPDPLSPLPQRGAQARLQAEPEPRGRKALVKGNLGLLEGTVPLVSQWRWHRVAAGAICPVVLLNSGGASVSFRAAPVRHLLKWKAGMAAGTMERATCAHPQEEGGATKGPRHI